MKRIVHMMKALGEDNRFRIAMMLRERELCVCEICDLLDISLSTVSSHLKQLSHAGIVKGCRDGRWISYTVTEDSLVRQVLDLLANAVAEKEPIAADRRKLEKLDREQCAANLRAGRTEEEK